MLMTWDSVRTWKHRHECISCHKGVACYNPSCSERQAECNDCQNALAPVCRVCGDLLARCEVMGHQNTDDLDDIPC